MAEFANRPIVAIDLDGLDDVWIHTWNNINGDQKSSISYSTTAEGKPDPMFEYSLNEYCKRMGIDRKMIPAHGTYVSNELNNQHSQTYSPEVTISEHRFNPFKRLFYGISNKLNSFSSAENGYEAEDWVGAMSIGASGEVSAGKYSLSFGCGIYSESENYAGAFFDITYGVSLSNDNSIVPSFGGESGITLYSEDEFTNIERLDNTTSGSVEANIPIRGINFGMEHSTSLEGKTQNSVSVKTAVGSSAGPKAEAQIKNETSINLISKEIRMNK